MSFYTSFSERAIDVKDFSSIESQGLKMKCACGIPIVVVSLLSCLPQHQPQPMPTAIKSIAKACENVKRLLEINFCGVYIPVLKHEVLTPKMR